MSTSTASYRAPSTIEWAMPLSPHAYDRRPLSVDERRALREYAAAPPKSGERRRVIASLDRLIAPIRDVWRLRFPSGDDHKRPLVTMELLLAMDERGTSFWQWSEDDWVQVLALKDASGRRREGRCTIIDMAYLLCAFDRWVAIGPFYWRSMAAVVFGESLVQEQTRRLGSVLHGADGMGFSDAESAHNDLHKALCRLFIYNRTPYIDALTRDLVERVACDCRGKHEGLAGLLSYRMPLALEKLGILAPVAEEQRESGYDAEGVPMLWYEWALAWKERSGVDLGLEQQEKYVGSILMAGRWLSSTHPDITAPDQWTDDIALSYRSDLEGRL